MSAAGGGEASRNSFELPVLRTPRLLLRKLEERDARDVYEYASDPETVRYLTWYEHPNIQYTRDYLRTVTDKYARHEFYDWAVMLRQDGKVLGTCGYTTVDTLNSKLEAGYVLNRAYWGQGLMCEALRAVIMYGFERLGYNRVEARCMEGNRASERVMQKCGMQYEGTLREALYSKGVYQTIRYYSMLHGDYRRMRAESSMNNY